jgi:Carboxypeptidase regulatory-like domain
MPAFGADAPTAAVGQPASIVGTVKDAAGIPIVGAHVTGSGPATATTTTGAGGAFALSVPPGVYRISVESGGFQPATLSDIAVVTGSSQPLRDHPPRDRRPAARRDPTLRARRVRSVRSLR